MKKIFFLFALLAVMAGCSKESLFEETPSTTTPTKKGYVFNFNVSADGETRAVKKTFVDGDKLFVFFDEVAGGMLTLEMSEGKWVATPNEALQSADLSATSSHNLVVVWVDGNKAPTLSDGEFAFINSERMASAKTPYNIEDNEVTATIVMKHESNSIKISVEIAGLEEDENPWILVGGNSQFAVTPDADGIWSAVSSTKAGDCEGIVYEDGEAKGVYFMVNPEIDLNKVTVIHDIDKYVREFEGKNAADYAGKAIKMTGPDYGNLDDVCNNWNHYVYYPDANFRNHMINISEFDTNNDGEISISEAGEEHGYITVISCRDLKIKSLRGIEYCTNLHWLACENNKLTCLDLSKNKKLIYVGCDYNNLKNLNVSNCENLTMLSCGNNQLASIDVSNNLELESLTIEFNNLESLDVTHNLKLTALHCGYNEIKTLDLKKNTELSSLIVNKNQLSKLELDNNTKLTVLEFESNDITNINLEKLESLQTLNCSYNDLGSIDLNSNLKLKDLRCYHTNLARLDVSRLTKLEDLNCSNNQIEELDLSNCTLLQTLYCGSNKLRQLDTGSNTELSILDCRSNELESLDLKSNTELSRLICNGNNLTELDLSFCEFLKLVDCRNKSLETLYLSEDARISSFDYSEGVTIIYK